MGKFRNGELADDSIGFSVDLVSFALHYELRLGRTLSLPGGQSGPLCDVAEQELKLLRGRGQQISVILGFESTSRRSECPVSPEATARNASMSVGTNVMGSKRQTDPRGNTRTAVKWSSSKSPTPHYGICP